MMKKTSAKKINGNIRPGKAKREFSPVFINGKKHVIR
jgi:hypothetical protein